MNKVIFIMSFIWTLFYAILFMLVINSYKFCKKIISETGRLVKWSFDFNKDIYLK